MNFAPILAVLPFALLAVWTRPAAAQDDGLVGMWSRYLSTAHMREVIEFREDGIYTSGLCVSINTGWCQGGNATPSRRGTYSVQGNSLTDTKGLIRIRPEENRPERQETYSWRSVRDRHDDPPHPGSRPPLRTLHLTSTDMTLQFKEMPPDKHPSWK
jgi:hypothetical protein